MRRSKRTKAGKPVLFTPEQWQALIEKVMDSKGGIFHVAEKDGEPVLIPDPDCPPRLM